jgi:hypothetical protein
MDHVLSAARRRAVLAIAQQQAQVKQAAEKELGELGAAMNELLSLYTSAAKLDGEWQFVQNAAGEIVLRPVEPPKAETPVLEEQCGDGDSPTGN